MKFLKKNFYPFLVLLIFSACDESDIPTVEATEVKKVDLGKIVESSKSHKSEEYKVDIEEESLIDSDSKEESKSVEQKKDELAEDSSEDEVEKEEYQEYSKKLESQIQTYGYGSISAPPPVPTFGGSNSGSGSRTTNSVGASGDVPPTPPVFK